MGRYYTGDIEGKFWFGIQSSNAADRFGVTGNEPSYEPSYIQYNFQEEDLEGVEEEIKNIEESLGEKKQIIDKFFEDNNGFNDEMLEDLGISNDELSDYADLELGVKIKDQIKNFGSCSFDAEL